MISAKIAAISVAWVHGPGLQLPPLLLGGGQEGGYRSGTENLPLIAGFAAACREHLPKRMAQIGEQARLKVMLQDGLKQIPAVTLLGAQEAPHIVNMAVAGLRSQGLLNGLQEAGICVSAGSACSKGHRSHVLEAMGVDPVLIDGSVRVSLSSQSTEEEVRQFLNVLPQVIESLR